MDNIGKIYNANVIEAGTKSYLGKVKEVELPKLVMVQDEHEALGMISKLSLWTGTFDELEAKLTWSAFDADAWALAADPTLSRKIQIRSNYTEYSSAGLATQSALVVLLTIQPKSIDILGKLAKGTSAEGEEDYTCTYVKVTLGSRELCEYDAQNQIYKVDGKDILATYKTNLGL